MRWFQAPSACRSGLRLIETQLRVAAEGMQEVLARGFGVAVAVCAIHVQFVHVGHPLGKLEHLRYFLRAPLRFLPDIFPAFDDVKKCRAHLVEKGKALVWLALVVGHFVDEFAVFLYGQFFKGFVYALDVVDGNFYAARLLMPLRRLV